MADFGRVFRCSYCSYVCRRYRNLINHLFLTHSDLPRFNVTCTVATCVNKYTDLRSYKRHLKLTHNNFYLEHFTVRRVVEAQLNNDNLNVNDNLNEDDFNDNDALENPIIPVIDFNKKMATFLLKLQNEHQVTDVACAKVASAFLNLIELNNEQISLCVRTHLYEKFGQVDID